MCIRDRYQRRVRGTLVNMTLLSDIEELDACTTTVELLHVLRRNQDALIAIAENLAGSVTGHGGADFGIVDEEILMFIIVAMSPRLSLIHISEPTRLLSISYAVFCLKKKKNNRTKDILNDNRDNKYKNNQ
eukprot:TRINITY_DN39056_c0_g1_i1.p1 TRINITY_DN39056_c0_g1~~TRINITY_DN39056_c0_g1_i1.p1  ORF type:complete len:131 (-),score=41.18 TRINITY_DN39056_c0_g1_i1:72-464(-)